MEIIVVPGRSLGLVSWLQLANGTIIITQTTLDAVVKNQKGEK